MSAVASSATSHLFRQSPPARWFGHHDHSPVGLRMLISSMATSLSRKFATLRSWESTPWCISPLADTQQQYFPQQPNLMPNRKLLGHSHMRQPVLGFHALSLCHPFMCMGAPSSESLTMKHQHHQPPHTAGPDKRLNMMYSWPPRALPPRSCYCDSRIPSAHQFFRDRKRGTFSCTIYAARS